MRYVVNTLSRKRLVDKLVEAYVDWREACAHVNDVYRYWACETGSRDKVRFGLYMAALDAEQRAADVYAGLVGRACKVHWGKDPPAEALRGAAWGCDRP
jgi:hypothetical protein